MKKLTIIITGRNDNYHEDYIFKTSYILNNTLETIYKNKLEKYFEIIFIDWGSKKLLSDTLYIEKDFRKSIKFYHVPKNIEKKEIDYKRRINTSKAHNFGIRKSNTEFCLLSHSDQIYPSYVLKNLKNLINGDFINKKIFNKSYIYVPRKYLSYDYFKNYPSNQMIERYFQNINFSLQKWKNPSFIVGGGWGGILAKKKIFENLEGLKEDYYISKSEGQISPDLDFHQKSSSKYDSIDASNYGIFTYRFYNASKEEKNSNKINNREKYLVRRLPPNNDEYKKNPNWGLKNFKIGRKKITNKIKVIEKKHNLKEIFKKIHLSNDLKYIAAVSKKHNIFSFDLEILYIYFIIKYFKIYGYLEIFVKKKNIFQIISDIFSGIDTCKVDLKKNKKLMNMSDEFKILNSLNSKRIGYTKVCSYESISDCMKIFDFTPPEKNCLLAKVELNSKNFSVLTKKLNDMDAKISYLIINKNFKIGNKLNKHYKLILDKKDFAFLVNKKLYKPSTITFFNNIFKHENMARVLYTLFINVNRFRKI